jgi:hypothetical protein
MKGRLQDRSLESLMRDLQSRTASGILTISARQREEADLLREGDGALRRRRTSERTVSPSSSVRSWALPEGARSATPSSPPPRGRRLAEVLVGVGRAEPEAMRDPGARAHLRHHLSLLRVEGGASTGSRTGCPNIIGEDDRRHRSREIALERAGRQVTGAQIEKGALSEAHGDRQNRQPAGTRGQAPEDAAAETFVLERAASAATLEDVLRLSPEGEYEIATPRRCCCRAA